MNYHLKPFGDNAIVIHGGDEINPQTQNLVQSTCEILERQHEEWLIEYVPAYTSVTLFYDIYIASKLAKKHEPPFETVSRRIHELLSSYTTEQKIRQRVIEIPVCYGGAFGPDLSYVAEHNGLTPEEVIDIHSTGNYTVYMIGFAPGFPFVGGMPEKIATPRRKTPRLKIPPRTVGIGGKQTGIYPIETPGGWQLIGRTPIELFYPGQEPPTLLQAGDKIQFKPISLKEYKQWEVQSQ
ncbi:5-oxoprolinase subunit PxpB [Siminovitchia sp. FSL W7-1587]|uniref:5-oxoprolinase subunit PxpB n=1 Tax=Siminovitchia sp. FSL W7-1587 TaxID=2954699 RepID=UPI0030CDC8EE